MDTICSKQLKPNPINFAFLTGYMINATEPQRTQTEIASLKASVKNSRYLVIGIIFVILLAYIINFGFLVHAPLSKDPSHWGQLGDYVGGILNPFIAFFAFFWLSQSVLIQKEELADTKKALQESAQTQLQQEKHAARTAQINALNTLLTSHDNDISNLRNNIEFISSQLASGRTVWLMDGNPTSQATAIDHVQTLNRALTSSLNKRETLRDQISNLLQT